MAELSKGLLRTPSMLMDEMTEKLRLHFSNRLTNRSILAVWVSFTAAQPILIFIVRQDILILIGCQSLYHACWLLERLWLYSDWLPYIWLLLLLYVVGNLTLCPAGYTVNFFVKPERGSLKNNGEVTYFLSTGNSAPKFLQGANI